MIFEIMMMTQILIMLRKCRRLLIQLAEILFYRRSVKYKNIDSKSCDGYEVHTHLNHQSRFQGNKHE
jgi:hypothetical protein